MILQILPGVGRWQPVSRSIIPVDLELLHPIHALECTEALQRNLRRSSDKLQELGTVGLVKGTQCSPEPLNLVKIKIY